MATDLGEGNNKQRIAALEGAVTEIREGLTNLEELVVELKRNFEGHSHNATVKSAVVYEITGEVTSDVVLGDIVMPPPDEEEPPPPPPPHDWKTADLLLPEKGKCVFGYMGADLDEVSTLIERQVGLTTLYWKELASPASRVGRNLDNGIVTRVELELTEAFCQPVSKGGLGANPEGLWRRIANGEYDAYLRIICVGLGRVCSICHEADLAPSEQGGYNGVKAGSPQDFADMWRHVATIIREQSPETYLYFNMSFNQDRWGEELTDDGSTGMYPGHKYVDIVGWDGFCWLNVPWHEPPSDRRTSFDQMMNLRERWAWFKKYFGEYGSETYKPLWIGETACCEADPPHQPADEWMDDMREWAHAHPELTAIIWFGANDWRSIPAGPQKREGARKLGQDPLFV